MPSWKKIIVSGSNAELNQVTASFSGDGSNITGISADSLANALTVDDTTIQLNSGTTYNGSAARTISVKDGGVDADALASGVSGNGLTGGGGSALAVGAGDGITVNTNDVAITAAQTTITSVKNNSLIIGGNSQNNTIDFGTDDVILFDTDNTERMRVDAAGIDVTGAITSTGAITADGDIVSKGDITAQGDIIAQRYIVSSSVNIITSSFSSGSTIFGNDMDDTHQFTGSVFITGSTTVSETLTATNIGAFTAAGAINFNNENMTNVDIDSGDIASGVTINKSPTITLGGDLGGSLELTALAGGTLTATIQADSVQGTMLNDDVADDSTIEISSNNLSVLKVPNSLTVDDATITLNSGTTYDGSGGKTISVKDGGIDEDALATSVAGSGIAGGGGSALSVDFTELTGASPTFTNLTLSGNLTVNGTTSTIATSNLEVQDAFGFFATGSAGTNVDAGIIVQSGSAVDSGSALYHDISSKRWAVAKNVASTATSVTEGQWQGFVATVNTGSDSPIGSSPNYGVGEIHVDADGEIYIYS